LIFREVVAVYSENNRKINTLYVHIGLLNVKTDGARARHTILLEPFQNQNYKIMREKWPRNLFSEKVLKPQE
jgi:hypothetical protein